jgi:hypothetical protein
MLPNQPVADGYTVTVAEGSYVVNHASASPKSVCRDHTFSSPPTSTCGFNLRPVFT